MNSLSASRGGSRRRLLNRTVTVVGIALLVATGLLMSPSVSAHRHVVGQADLSEASSGVATRAASPLSAGASTTEHRGVGTDHSDNSDTNIRSPSRWWGWLVAVAVVAALALAVVVVIRRSDGPRRGDSGSTGVSGPG